MCDRWGRTAHGPLGCTRSNTSTCVHARAPHASNKCCCTTSTAPPLLAPPPCTRAPPPPRLAAAVGVCCAARRGCMCARRLTSSPAPKLPKPDIRPPAQIRFGHWGGEITGSKVVNESELKWLVARAVQVAERRRRGGGAGGRLRAWWCFCAWCGRLACTCCCFWAHVARAPKVPRRVTMGHHQPAPGCNMHACSCSAARCAALPAA